MVRGSLRMIVAGKGSVKVKTLGLRSREEPSFRRSLLLTKTGPRTCPKRLVARERTVGALRLESETSKRQARNWQDGTRETGIRVWLERGNPSLDQYDD